MLVLSRQRDGAIMIGDEIEITVVDIRGDKVRLGITAPSRIAVHRKEVYDAIRAENQQASTIIDVELLPSPKALSGEGVARLATPARADREPSTPSGTRAPEQIELVPGSR